MEKDQNKQVQIYRVEGNITPLVEVTFKDKYVQELTGFGSKVIYELKNN